MNNLQKLVIFSAIVSVYELDHKNVHQMSDMTLCRSAAPEYYIDYSF